MRTVFALIFSIVCFSVACEPVTYTVNPPVVSGPMVYVFTYADGSCWADDLPYDRCPWAMGPSYGYYGWYDGRFVYNRNHVWPHRANRNYLPPPHSWHPRPLVRDHRHH